MIPKSAGQTVVQGLLVSLMALVLTMQPVLAEELDGDPAPGLEQSDLVPTATAKPTEVPPPPTSTPLPASTPTIAVATATPVLPSPSPTATLEPSPAANLEQVWTPTLTETPIIEPELNCEGSLERNVKVGGIVEIDCEVTIYDSRADAWLEIDPPAGWLVRIGENEWQQEKVKTDPFGLKRGESISRYELEIDVRAPAAGGVRGEVALLLRTSNELFKRLDIGNTTFVPENWTLRCVPITDTAYAGAQLHIDCELPREAWALNDGTAAYHVSPASGVLGSSATAGAIQDANFTVLTVVPCSIDGIAWQVVITAAIAEGLRLSSSVSTQVEQIEPSLSVIQLLVNPQPFSLTSQRATGIVLLQVENPSKQCHSWFVTLSVATSTESSGPDLIAIDGFVVQSETSQRALSSIAGAVGATLTEQVSVAVLGSYAAPGTYQIGVKFSFAVGAGLSAGHYPIVATATLSRDSQH